MRKCGRWREKTSGQTGEKARKEGKIRDADYFLLEKGQITGWRPISESIFRVYLKDETHADVDCEAGFSMGSIAGIPDPLLNLMIFDAFGEAEKDKETKIGALAFALMLTGPQQNDTYVSSAGEWTWLPTGHASPASAPEVRALPHGQGSKRLEGRKRGGNPRHTPRSP